MAIRAVKRGLLPLMGGQTMLNEPTLDKLREMRLTGMADTWLSQQQDRRSPASPSTSAWPCWSMPRPCTARTGG